MPSVLSALAMSDSVSQKSIEKEDVKSVQDDVPIAKVDTAYNADFLAAVEKTALNPRSARAFKVSSFCLSCVTTLIRPTSVVVLHCHGWLHERGLFWI